MRALDGLRGLAVVAVLFFHDGRLRGGYLGVDLFFVLSGFLITTLLLVEVGRDGRIGLRHFYERRARRLLPALGLALAGVALYAAVWARPAELPRIRWDGIATLFYFQNWREILTKQSYWDVFTAPSPLQHAWSLSIEEQFYAIWPLLVIGALAFKRTARSVLALAVVLGTACTIFTVAAARHDANQRLLYYSTMSRAPALLMGAALAAFVVIRGPIASRRGRIVLEVAAVVGAIYLAREWSHQPGDVISLYRGPLLLCGVAAAAVIASAAHPDRGPISRVLALPPLVGLGLISYGLYLFHWPVYLVLTQSRTGLSGWGLFGERVGVSVVIAIASYFVVEQPIRRGALRPARAAIALGTATAVVAAALVVTTRPASVPIAPATNASRVDWPMPVAPQIAQVNYGFLPPGDWSRLTNLCDVHRPPPPVRTIGRTAAPKVMVVGDSVACFLGAALDMNQVHDGVVTLNRSRLGCPIIAPVRVRSPDHAPIPVTRACIDGQQSAVTAFDPDVAVLLVGSPQTDESDIGNGQWVTPCDPAFEAWYEQGTRRAIEVLSASGATVVVVTVVHKPPKVELGPGNTLPKEYDHDIDCQNHALRGAVAAEPYARLLDLDAYVCPHGACRASIDGVTLRSDAVHFIQDAATVIAEWMLPKVLQLAHLKARPGPV